MTQAERATKRRDAERAVQKERAASRRAPVGRSPHAVASEQAGESGPVSRSPDTAASKEHRKLAPSEIEYLVFEGGGGKGFAFLGALEILEKHGHGLLKQPSELDSGAGTPPAGRLKGVGGASAGAITALLVSLGYTSAELKTFLLGNDFNRFFDTPSPRAIPAVGKPYLTPWSTNEARNEDDRLPEADKQLIRFIDGFPQPAQKVLVGVPVMLGLDVKKLSIAAASVGPLMGRYRELAELLDVHLKTVPGKTVIPRLGKYFVYARDDMGFFSGEYARQFFDDLIQARVTQFTGRPTEEFMNFRDLRRHCNGVKLLVTATNLRTSTTQIFSADDTPDFPVADAIRISMGLPFVYKPYRIEDRYEGVPCGLYVDGGVFNNLPYREFDAVAPEQQGRKSASPGVAAQSADRRRTLGLRLAIDPPAEINNFSALLGNAIKLGVFGTGESQVLSKHVKQMITLDTDGLDLLVFSPPDSVQEVVAKRARRQTREYFGLPVDLNDIDTDDDKRR
jgi:predicted acylesterase/phospholipase RssA